MQGIAPAAPFDSRRAAPLRDAVGARMRELLARHRGGVYDLVEYHLGWRDEHGHERAGASGKLMRPLVCLTAASGYGDAADALGAAAAVELLHAFSLVHDDIEDGDRERRHRLTLWALHGVPLAINAGDGLFALAYRTLHEGATALPPERAVLALRLFDSACLRMIEGQHYDLAFEATPSVSADEYLAMSAGKTGALLGASLALGALCGGAPGDDVERLQEAGVEIGLAFQAVDDALSVWGDASRTGKAVGNDVARGKKSLPAVLAADRGLPVEHQDVRDAVMRLARDRAGRARALIAATAMARPAIDELDGMIEFTLRRES